MTQNPKIINVHGAQVAIYPIPSLEAVSICIRTRAGSWLEENGQYGKAHLLEHMLFQGSDKLPSSESMDIHNEENGISSNASTSGSQMCLTLRMPGRSISHGIDLASQMLFHPIISPENLQKEKDIVCQEYADKWSRPSARFGKKINQQYFGTDHPYTHDSLGEIAYIQKITAEDLHAFREQFIVPANMTIGIAGNVDADQVEKLLKAVLPDPGNQAQYSFAEISPEYTPLTHLEPNMTSASVEIGWLCDGRDKTTLKERILRNLSSYLIGGGPRSLLFKKIRQELGLAYSISSSIASYPTAGFFSIYTSVKSENIDTVITEILQELKRYLDNPIDPAIFQRVKNYLIIRNEMNYESTMGIAEDLSGGLFWDNLILNSDQYAEIINSFTESDVRETLKKITSQKHLISIMKS